MNIFVHIERLVDFQYRKVRYFPVCFERAEVNEFFDFLNRMEKASKIDQLITSGEIHWNKDFTDIQFNENLEIEL